MVQTLAALLSWIAMLALIAIAVLVSGIWRPRARENVTALLVPQLPTAAQARAKAEALADARSQARRRQRAA